MNKSRENDRARLLHMLEAALHAGSVELAALARQLRVIIDEMA